MTSAIVYYSYTGNTHHAAQLIENILKKRGEEVVPIRIRPLKEAKNFLVQFMASLFAGKPEIYRTLLDLSSFDRIFIGSPIWAFKPGPAINTFLEKCNALAGKEAICFVTGKSFIGSSATLKFMKRALESRGARSIGAISFKEGESDEERREKILKLL